ncbi:MAG: tripartite tricarboxylate transporter permease [Alkalilacustris sp.]
MLADLPQAFLLFATDLRLIGFVCLGVLLGVFVGAVPGLTATLAIALLLPFTFGMPALEAVVLMTGIFVGGIYGGSVTAIMVRVPGAPANTMTMLDGFEMTRQGKPEVALGLATAASVFGGVVGGVLLILFAPQLARFSLQFQSPEIFALVVLALVAVAAVSQESLVKGLIATVIGLMISTIGIDIAGVPRYTFDVFRLFTGVPLIPLVIGLFALAEILRRLEEPYARPRQVAWLSLRRIFAFVPVWRGVGWRLPVKSSLIGALIGALPGAGAAMAAFLAYAEAKRSSAHPERFGTGTPEGIVAPEASNNAMTGGAFIPMLSFGIPGDAVTAVILSALVIQGIVPGPQLFAQAGELVLPLMAGFLLAYGVLMVVGLLMLPLFARLAVVDHAVLFPIIAAVSVVAAYVSERSVFAMGVMVTVGIVAWLMQRNGFSLVPVLLGVILGPLLERNFRRSMGISGGDPSIFVGSWIATILLVTAAAMAVYFAVSQFRRARGRP